MPHNIFDNRKKKLIDALKKELAGCKQADFVVGWFFLTGLRELKNEIDKLDKLRILAGSRTNKATAEIMLLAERYKDSVKKILEDLRYPDESTVQKILHDEAEAITRHISTIKPTKENIEFIKWFWQKLNEGKIEVRIYPKETLHAKLYLLHPDKKEKSGIAFVGSSNLSISGISLNTELNVALPEKENYKFLSQWFNDLWKDSERANFTEMLAQAIERSWVLNKDVTPFRVYLRLLHEIFSIEDFQEAEISKKFEEVELYDFQLDAVRDAYQRLQKYNGVFLADVPGLGKTYMGSALLAHLQEEGKRALVIGPPKLRENWKEVLSLFGVGTARFFSHGKLEDVLNDERLMSREVILIDESHHFRNPDSQRYKDMELICEGKQVILVGATPQNLSIWDLYNQIRLFTPSETFHQFRIDPPVLKEYFKACERGEASLENLIDQIIVRRTRKDIKELYTREEMKFPKRKGPYRVEYVIDKVYSEGLYKKLSRLIESLTFARYDVGSYIKPEAFITPDERQRIEIAGKNLKKIMKIILFRRLESSVAALRDSARWMRKSHDAFLKALSQKKILIGEAAEDVYNQIRGGADLEDIEVPEFAESIDKFNTENLERNIKNDRDVFSEIEKLISLDKIPPEKDNKLQILIKCLNSPEIKGKKTIIFTQFASTAKYLGEELKKYFSKVDYVSQDIGQVLTTAYRFSPKSNYKKISKEEEINILVSTEILSEGLNLQDGQVVINYELHWNPVRIIQRIGRIDRIGSEHDEIFVYNFFPQEEVEKEIKVETKVNKRIDEIIRLYGADEKTINLSEKEIRRKLFKIYTQDERSLEEEEIVSTTHAYRQKWLKLQKEYSEEYRIALSLPEMIGVGLKSKEDGIAVFCRAGDYFRLRLADLRGEISKKDDWKILPLVECLPNTKKEEILDNHYDISEKIRELFEKEANQRELKRQLLEKIKEQAIKRLDFLKRGRPEVFKDNVNKLISKIESVRLRTEDKKKLRKTLRKYGKEPEELIKEIQDIVSGLAIEPRTEIKQHYAQIILSASLFKSKIKNK